MNESKTILAPGHTFSGAGADWPSTSRPPSGAGVEGCWVLGLPSITLASERNLAPRGALTFTAVAEAEGHPALQRLLELDGVDAVTARGQTLVLSSRDASTDWDALRARAEEVVRDAFDATESDIRERVAQVIEQEINPGVAAHGGVIRLLDVKGTSVYLEMGGGCQGCGMSAVTLRAGVETAIKNAVPDVTEIVDATDHQAGANPYYAAGGA